MDALALLLDTMRVTEHTVFRNAQVKRYPDGSAVVTVFDRCIIRAPGFEAVEASRRAQDGPEAPEGPEAKSEPSEGRKAENLARAKRRAKAAVYDLARATDFEYFATFTVDPAKVLDRLDDDEVFRHLHDWLDNNVRRHGLAYVLVPEYHKAGGLHFHALVNGALRVVDSGTISLPGGGKPRRPKGKAQRRAWIDAGGQPVYNLPGWSFGFSTAIRLYGDREAAIGYVTKYITKSEAKIGGRWYYSGGALRRPSVETICADFTRAAELGEVWSIDELDVRGVRLKLEGGEVNETLGQLLRPAPALRDRTED